MAISSTLLAAVLPNADRASEWIAHLYVTDMNHDGWPDIFMSGLPIGGVSAGVADLYMNTGGKFTYQRPSIDFGAFSAPIRSATGRVDIVSLQYGTSGGHAVPQLWQSSLP